MISAANEHLIREYLDIAENAPENIQRFSALLTEDCAWYITPPGVEFKSLEQVRTFARMAMGSRSHDEQYRTRILNWFADGDNFCVEYYHGAIVSPLRLKVVENVCLVCHMRDGKFDRIHEYVDASRSLLIRIGLQFLPWMIRRR